MLNSNAFDRRDKRPSKANSGRMLNLDAAASARYLRRLRNFKSRCSV